MKPDDAERRWERFGRLLEPIHDGARTTARNLCRSAADGDDLFHEAVLRAFDRLPTLREEGRFRSWFFAVLLSVHRSRSRRAFWKRFRPLDEAPADAVDAAGDADRSDEERIAARRAARALARLPAEQREAVVLHEIEGFSLDEVAVLQGASLAAVKSRVLRGRERLRRIYEAMGWKSAPLPAERPERPRPGDGSAVPREPLAFSAPGPRRALPEGGRHD